MHDFLKLRLNVAIIFITKDNNNFNPSFDCYVSDSARPRMSQDKITDTRGNHVIDICVGNQLTILNGRLAGNLLGNSPAIHTMAQALWTM